MVIAIEGFLCEDTNKKDVWKFIENHYNKAEVYCLHWNSLTTSNFFNEGYLTGRKKKNFLQITFNVVKIGKKQFRYATDQAVTSGIILALYLLFSDFSNDRCVSIIGFSLGTLITLTCLKTLYYYYERGYYKAG